MDWEKTTCVLDGGERGPDHIFPSPLVIHSNDSYFVSDFSNLYRINPSTGNIDWAYDLDIGFAKSPCFLL